MSAERMKLARVGTNDEFVAAWAADGVVKPLSRVLRLTAIQDNDRSTVVGTLPLPLTRAKYDDVYEIDPRDFAALVDADRSGKLSSLLGNEGMAVRIVVSPRDEA